MFFGEWKNAVYLILAVTACIVITVNDFVTEAPYPMATDPSEVPADCATSGALGPMSGPAAPSC